MEWSDFSKQMPKSTLDDSYIHIIESIAKEEVALSNLINSESNKIQALIGTKLDFPTNPSNQEIITFSHSVNRIIDSVLMKEWLLLRKLETVIQAKDQRDSNEITKCKCTENDDEDENDEDDICKSCSNRECTCENNQQNEAGEETDEDQE